jgi:putative hydrolases of HD superfamily
MEEINKLRKLYQLKNVERQSTVGKRKESSAEHSWSCLILADYFLNRLKNNALDRLKVYELLMYHDVVEIEAGDTPIHHEEERKNKKELELKAAHKLKESFPEEIKSKFINLFTEFEEQETKEAKFAKAIDALDALMHFLDDKKAWKGWTEEMVRKFHGHYVEQFPELKESFDKMLEFCNQEGYFDQ